MTDQLCDICGRMVPPSHFHKNGKGRCAGKVRWTMARRFRLMTLSDAGMSNADIAMRMETTENAVVLARKRYGIGGTLANALSGRDVARVMGFSPESNVASRWIAADFLNGKRVRQMGRYQNWMVQMSDLYAFVEDERTWHIWTTERIADAGLRRHAEQVRGNVRFLTPGESAQRLCVQPNTVTQWIHKGLLPGRRWGNWWIDERDIAHFEPPCIGSRRTHTAQAACDDVHPSASAVYYPYRKRMARRCVNTPSHVTGGAAPMHHQYTSYPTIANNNDEYDCPRLRAPPGGLSYLR